MIEQIKKSMLEYGLWEATCKRCSKVVGGLLAEHGDPPAAFYCADCPGSLIDVRLWNFDEVNGELVKRRPPPQSPIEMPPGFKRV